VAEIKLGEVQEARERGEQDREVEYYRPEREAQVLRRIIERDRGPLDGATVAHVFREIMSACLALERPLQVAFLGPEGTFTQAAAIKHFGHAAVCIPQVTIDGVFAEVESGNCNYGIVPVENSTEGMVSHTLDSFLDSPLKIVGEVEMRISHHLLVAPGTDAGQVTRICAHQQALAQCRNWLDTHWPRTEREAVSSNGEAARRAALEPGIAAVAGDMAAEAWKLDRLAAHIEDAAGQHHAFSGRRSQRGAAERARQDFHRRVQPQQARRAVCPAGSVPAQWREPDAHRDAALAHGKMGLRFFHRVRGTPAGSRGAADHARARGAVDSPQAPGLLPDGGPVSRGDA
jgi:chorismate mutase